MHNNLIILAGGASSRMKKDAKTDAGISAKTLQQANTRSKGLIEVGNPPQPFLKYLLYNAKQAGYQNIFIVISEKDESFPALYGSKASNNSFRGLHISYVRQKVPEGRNKPLGTADAVYQALEQYPQLQSDVFTVCNCDNLYSVGILKRLKEVNCTNALAAYDRDGLRFDEQRIARFALMMLDDDNNLLSILEKPELSKIDAFRDAEGKLRVSMNIFRFDGRQFYPFLKNCPIHPNRDEKELPTALLNMVQTFPKSVKAIPVSEHVIDMTSKEDIGIVGHYLEQYYPGGLNW